EFRRVLFRSAQRQPVILRRGAEQLIGLIHIQQSRQALADLGGAQIQRRVVAAATFADEELEQRADGAQLPLQAASGQAALVPTGDVLAQQGVVHPVPVVDLPLLEKAAAAEKVPPVGGEGMLGQPALAAQMVEKA